MNPRSGFIALLLACLFPMLLMSSKLFPGPLYEKAISESLQLRIWEGRKSAEGSEYVFTFHYGFALTFLRDNLRIPASELELYSLSSSKEDVDVVYDDQLGVVFIYDKRTKAFWSAGHIHGSDGSELKFWIERINSISDITHCFPRTLIDAKWIE